MDGEYIPFSVKYVLIWSSKVVMIVNIFLLNFSFIVIFLNFIHPFVTSSCSFIAICGFICFSQYLFYRNYIFLHIIDVNNLHKSFLNYLWYVSFLFSFLLSVNMKFYSLCPSLFFLHMQTVFSFKSFSKKWVLSKFYICQYLQ